MTNHMKNLSCSVILLLLTIQAIGQNRSATNVFPEDGNVGIGVIVPNYKLEVNGIVRSKEVLVESAPWPDFVFEPGYDLPSLTDVEQYIAKNGHLEHVPTAATVEENGVEVGEMSAKLLQKIEELTLYLIEQDKQIKALKKEVSALNELQPQPDKKK